MSTRKHQGFALTLLALSQLILALDYTIIFVALPSLGEALGFTTNHLQWVVSAYSLLFGGFLLIGGRLSDMLGQRRMFMIAMTLFGIGSLLGGLAPTPFILILARGIQGFGGALLAPATLSLIMSNFAEGEERNRALSIWAAMGGVGLSLGLLLGGLLTSYMSWKAVFFVNVPIALFVIVSASFALKESTVHSGERRYDVAGAVSVTAGMILLVYYLIQAPVEGWLRRNTLVPGLVGLALLVTFIMVEGVAKEPLLPFRLFRNRNLTGATLTAALFSASFGTLYYFLTLYTQQVLHDSAVRSGLAFLPLTLSALVGSRFVNKLVAAIGIASTIACGMLLGSIGFLLLTHLSERGSIWGIIPGTIVIGIGQAFVFTTMFIAAGIGIAMQDQGIASSIVNTGQQLGSSVGLAVIMVILTAQIGSNTGLGTLNPVRLNTAIHSAFVTAAIIAWAGICLAFLLLRRRKSVEARSKAQLF